MHKMTGLEYSEHSSGRSALVGFMPATKLQNQTSQRPKNVEEEEVKGEKEQGEAKLKITG